MSDPEIMVNGTPQADGASSALSVSRREDGAGIDLRVEVWPDKGGKKKLGLTLSKAQARRLVSALEELLDADGGT